MDFVLSNLPMSVRVRGSAAGRDGRRSHQGGTPGGSPTRAIGPFIGDTAGADRSVFFALHNRAKQSVVLDLDDSVAAERFATLVGSADVVLESTAAGYLDDRELSDAALAQRFPHLVRARMTAFGDTGPWSGFKANDLVHLALGGPIMNCGYDPEPYGHYDLPPIAPQLWQSLVIAGEQLVIGILAAVVHQGRTGQGQAVSCAIHEAVAKSTELDLMNWVMRRAPMYRQTCRHAAEKVSALPTIAQTKDGRWVLVMPVGAKDHGRIHEFLARHGITPDTADTNDSATEGRAIPGSSPQSGRDARLIELVQRLARKFCYDNFPGRRRRTPVSPARRCVSRMRMSPIHTGLRAAPSPRSPILSWAPR